MAQMKPSDLFFSSPDWYTGRTVFHTNIRGEKILLCEIAIFWSNI